MKKNILKGKVKPALLIIFFLFLVFLSIKGNTVSNKPAVTGQGATVTQQNSISPAHYEIIDEEDQSRKATSNKLLSEFTTAELKSLPTNKKMLYKVAVASTITADQVEPTVQTVIQEITSKDNEIDEVILWLYSDKELINDPYDIGTVIWALNGTLGDVTPEVVTSNNRDNYQFSFKIRDDLEEYLKNRNTSEEVHGFTEEERKSIYKELVGAGDRATLEANQKYPTTLGDPNYKQENLKLNLEYRKPLQDKYRNEVLLKYNIPTTVGSKIIGEGLRSNWPTK